MGAWSSRLVGRIPRSFLFHCFYQFYLFLEPHFDCTHLAMLKLTDWIVSKLSLFSTTVKSKLIFLSAVSISSFEGFLSFTIWRLFTLVSCQMYSCPGGSSELKSFADNWTQWSDMTDTAFVNSKLKYLAHFQTLPAFDNGPKQLHEDHRKKNPSFLPNVMNYFLFFNEWVLFIDQRKVYSRFLLKCKLWSCHPVHMFTDWTHTWTTSASLQTPV